MQQPPNDMLDLLNSYCVQYSTLEKPVISQEVYDYWHNASVFSLLTSDQDLYMQMVLAVFTGKRKLTEELAMSLVISFINTQKAVDKSSKHAIVNHR